LVGWLVGGLAAALGSRLAAALGGKLAGLLSLWVGKGWSGSSSVKDVCGCLGRQRAGRRGVGGVKGGDGCTAQAASKQHGLSQPHRASDLGVTGKNGGSKLGRGQGWGRALKAEVATLCLEDRGKRVTREEVESVEPGGFSAEGAGVVNPRVVG